MKPFLLLAALFCCTAAFSQVTSILLDYDAVDELEASGEGGDYIRELWNLNSRFPDNPLVIGLTWALVKFDTLHDANSDTAFVHADKEITVDSIRVFFSHVNHSGNPDTLVISVYRHQGIDGVEFNSLEQIANEVLYDSVIIVTASFSPASIGSVTIRPRLKLAMGERFLAGIHYYGAFSDSFRILSGYADLCSGFCYAAPSSFESNSYYRIIYWDGPFSSTGINTMSYDCNGNLLSEPDECELFTIQNLVIQAFVSFGEDTASSVHFPVPAAMKIYPQPASEVAFLEVTGLNPPVAVTLLDAMGRRVESHRGSSFNRRMQMDIRHLPAGLYFVEVSTPHHTGVLKLVKN